MTPSLSDLISRVEGAREPSRELDAAICAALRYVGPLEDRLPWVRNWKGLIVAEGDLIVLQQDDGGRGPWAPAPVVTSSLDAALALVERVLPGWSWSVRRSGFGNPADAEVWNPLKAVGVMAFKATNNAGNPALALILALLLALQEGIGN